MNYATLRRLVTYVSHHKAALVFGILCLLSANFIKAAVPIVVQQSMDSLGRGGTRSLLLRHCAAIIVLGLLYGAFVFAQERLLLGMARMVERDMKNDFYRHLQTLPLKFFAGNSIGELMARATNDIGSAVNASSEAMMYSADTLVALMVILPLMARLSWQLASVAVVPLLLIIFATLILQERMRTRFCKTQESFARIYSQLQEILSAPRTVRAYTQEKIEIEAFERTSKQYLRDNLRHVRLSGTLYPLLQFLIGLSVIAVLWFGGSLTAAGRLSIGQFMQFILYVGYLAWPMHVLGWEMAVLQRGVVSMGRVESVLSCRSPIHDSSCVLNIGNIKGAIEFQNVSFRYEGMDVPALDGISLRINPGQMVGLVGAVGSGKSTLMHMVPRLLGPCSGKVLIDGYPIDQIPLAVLRSAIGYVPQETFLFSETVAANIAFGNREATQQEIEQAAHGSGIAFDITAFPEGYQTVIGERGVTVSGGQRQRITIARALLMSPAMLLLDDALSSVDLCTEQEILAHLRKIMRGKTCMLSSHRISAVKDADLILVLHEGRIVEQGTHNELLAGGGLYAEMQAMQVLEEDLAAT